MENLEKKFVHLHLHTEYSILDGMATISKVCKKAKKLGMPAIAITDHGNMYGAVNFFDTCQKEGIKAIIGSEFYVCDNLYEKTRVKIDENDEGYKDRRHLILLVKNEEGYKNMCRLQSIAFRDGFYYKPRIDLKTLSKYCEGLICLSACLGGDIPQAILRNDIEEARELVKFFKGLFKDDFYLELQNHGIAGQEKVNSYLKLFAKEFDVKTVVTNDVHYIDKEDAAVQDILMCVQTGRNFDDKDRMRMPCDEFYLKSYDELYERFPDDKDALDRTLEIADKCTFEFEYGNYKFPNYKPENGDDPYTFINKLIDEGIEKKCGGVRTKEIDERLKVELEIISRLKFIEYYLIVWDYIHFAKTHGISVGPGRGSGAGSLVAYLIDITDIDPLKYNLYFERFLNPERVSAPDFDVDFEDSRRQEVIDYVRDKYGSNRVAKIVTFGTMAAKNAVKDVGRVLGVPFAEMNKLTKIISDRVVVNGKTFTIKKPILAKILGRIEPKDDEKEQGLTSYANRELLDIYNNDPTLQRVLDYAAKLEGSPRQASTHACGVIIGHDVLQDHMPLSRNGEDIVTQYVGTELEHLGFLKMDFLGLRNLSDIKECIEFVKENHGVDIKFNSENVNDPKVYNLISSGNTDAIFQIESGGFKEFLRKLKPSSLEDIVAAVSLYRPGPMDSIGDFVYNKHNPQDIKYATPKLKPILEQTYGTIVYQEQVMKIVQELAGFTLGQADNVRRMMGKKKVDDMKKQKEIFINGKEETVDAKGKVSAAITGCVKNGISKEIATDIWNKMEDFAKYAFNKSHAAAYSLVTYQTAYLKCYYEPEFITAVLNNRITNITEIITYTRYAKSEGIQVLQPDINESKTFFSVKNDTIRFGLAAIKGVGIVVIDDIIKEREENGKFSSFEDFITRCAKNLNKKMVSSLIKGGAFDCFGRTRSQLLAIHEEAVDKGNQLEKNKNSLQISIFDFIDDEGSNDVISIDYPDIPEWPAIEKLNYEKEVCGIYVSSNPLDKYDKEFKRTTFNSGMVKELEDEEGNIGDVEIEGGIKEGDKVTVLGIINNITKRLTKKGDPMAILEVEDVYGAIECPLFSQSYKKYFDNIRVNEPVIITGRLGLRGTQVNITIDSIEFLEDKQEEVKKVETDVKCLGLIIDNSQVQTIYEILEGYPGEMPVYLKIDGKNYLSSYKVRECDGLLSELQLDLDIDKIKIFDMKVKQ